MAMPSFNSSKLKERLTKLNSKQQIAFGALCCERLLPNYLAFQQDSGWGNTSLVRNALDTVWSYVNEQPEHLLEIQKAVENCESAIPDSDDFDSLYVTSAQDACFAICSLLDYIVDNDLSKIVQAANCSTDSVDLYVQEIENMSPNDPNLEQKILMHPLMQRELSQQESDIEAIAAVQSISPEFIGQRIASWNNNGKSNLDLPRNQVPNLNSE